MNREQRTIQGQRLLWTYKESPGKSDRSPRILEVSKTGLTGITDEKAGDNK